MNKQQQEQKAGWVNWLWSAILWAIDHYGDDVLDIIKTKIDEKQANRGPEGGTYPNCDPGYTGDPVLKRCVKDPLKQ